MYVTGVGTYDVVYSWGVLHHNGDMWRALRSIQRPVAPGGRLFIAIYNDQRLVSRYWRLSSASSTGCRTACEFPTRSR